MRCTRCTMVYTMQMSERALWSAIARCPPPTQARQRSTAARTRIAARSPRSRFVHHILIYSYTHTPYTIHQTPYTSPRSRFGARFEPGKARAGEPPHLPHGQCSAKRTYAGPKPDKKTAAGINVPQKKRQRRKKATEVSLPAQRGSTWQPTKPKHSTWWLRESENRSTERVPKSCVARLKHPRRHRADFFRRGALGGKKKAGGGRVAAFSGH
jgi:hypothetical protein